MYSHTASRGALMTSSRSTLIGSAHEREAALGREVVELALHLGEHVTVDLVHVGLLSELVAQIDRRQHLDGDLRGQWNVSEHVADVQAPWDRQGDRQHLQPEGAVDPE